MVDADHFSGACSRALLNAQTRHPSVNGKQRESACVRNLTIGKDRRTPAASKSTTCRSLSWDRGPSNALMDVQVAARTSAANITTGLSHEPHNRTRVIARLRRECLRSSSSEGHNPSLLSQSPPPASCPGFRPAVSVNVTGI